MNIIYNLIYFASAAFGMYWINRNAKGWLSVASLALILGFMARITIGDERDGIGTWLYLGAVVMMLLYGLVNNRKKPWPRFLLSGMVALSASYWIAQLLEWPGLMLWTAPAVLVLGAAALLTRAKLREELGILTMIAADSAVILLKYLLMVR